MLACILIAMTTSSPFQADDPRFWDLFPTGPEVELLATGYRFLEGPIWMPDGHLVFSDIPGNTLHRWDPKTRKAEAWREKVFAGEYLDGQGIGPNGNTLDPQGRLVTMEHGNRRVSRWNPDGTRTVLADKFEGKRFNSPNDGVYAPWGDLYFTDPTWGLPKGKEDPSRELDFCGIYRLRKDGKVELLAKDLILPNGLAFSPDHKKLYVSDSDPSNRLWQVYDVQPDGSLKNSRIFFDGRKSTGPGLPDGIKVDRHGNLWTGSLDGLQVISPEGRRLGHVTLPEGPANLCFGGPDGLYLYLTAGKSLHRIKLKP